MRILITGGTGLLGLALVDTANADYEISATYVGDYTQSDTDRVKYVKLDIRNIEGHSRLFREFKPEAVIHTAGVGSPDQAEKHKEETEKINIDGIRNIINHCEAHRSKFIYISSNGIYDGQNAPYKEEVEASPINYYGEIKLEGERLTRGCAVPHAIVRPILMYGWNHPFERPNIVTFAISQLKKGAKVFAYDEVYVTPLFARNCAEAIWKIIEKGKYETFNIGGSQRASVYELVRNAAGIFGLDANLVLPVKQGFFSELVKRPRDTSYDTEKMRKVLGVKPLSINEGLMLMKKSKDG